MFPKKILNGSIVIISLIAFIYLVIQLNGAYGEFLHWKSREAFLEKKLEELRCKEVKSLIFDKYLK